MWSLHHGLISLKCVFNPPFTSSLCAEGRIILRGSWGRGGREGTMMRHISPGVCVMSSHFPLTSLVITPVSQVKTWRLKAVAGFPWGHMPSTKLPIFSLSHVFKSLLTCSPLYLQCPAERQVCSQGLSSISWVGISGGASYLYHALRPSSSLPHALWLRPHGAIWAGREWKEDWALFVWPEDTDGD